LLLGRLIPDYFPKIFGKSEKEPLDSEASRVAFEKVAKEINESHEINLGLDDIVYGLVQHSYSWYITLILDVRFIKVANETMCRPIRALTEARGYSTGKHVYVWCYLAPLSPLHTCSQARKLRRRRWSTRLRDCKFAWHKDHSHPSIQLHFICIWIGTSRSASVYPAVLLISFLN
jgi:N-methylhydantoinase A/oxoprolinase/acetone carboxylase beta subunit